MLKCVRDALKAPGYSTVSTVDPQEVPHLLRTHRPQLVQVDLLMPGIAGIELMVQVPELGDLAVIFISGYGRDETVALALEAGAADFIVKPFSPTELAARVQAALRQEGGDRYVRAGRPDDPLRGAPRDRGRACGGADSLGVRPAPGPSLKAKFVPTYESLLRRVWGGKDNADLRRARTYVKRLRQKLGDDATSSAYIVNERQVAYRTKRHGDSQPSPASLRAQPDLGQLTRPFAFFCS